MLPAGFSYSADGDKTALLTNNLTSQAIFITGLVNGDNRPELNFSIDWEKYVVSQGKLKGLIEQSTMDNGNGWVLVTGKSTIQIGENLFFVELKTCSKKGQKASLLYITMPDTGDQVFNDFLSSCKLQGNPLIKINQNQVAKTAEQTTTNSGYSAYGNMLYKLPSGWKTVSDGFGNKLKLMPATLRESEQFFVALLQPVGGATDFNTVAAQTWDMLARETADQLRDGFKANAGRIGRTIQGLEYVRLQKQTSRQNNLDITIDLILVKTPAAIERIALYDFELRAQGIDYSTVSSKDYFFTTEGLISTIQFSKVPISEVVQGRITGPEPVGVWCGLSGSYNGISGKYAQAESFLVFMNNGKVYLHRKMPVGGLASLNTVMHQQLYADYWADYSFAGGKGSFSNSYYKKVIFSVSDGKMKMIKNGMEHKFFKLPSFNGGKINGTYAFNTGESITFTADGHFTDKGALHILAHDVYFEPYQSTVRSGSGNYEIHDYSIIFRYTDGRVFQTAFTDYSYTPQTPSPEMLMLSENMDLLKRQ